MKKIIFLITLCFAFSCSKDDDSNKGEISATSQDKEYAIVKINGFQGSESLVKSLWVTKTKDVFNFYSTFGTGNEWHEINLDFTADNELLSAFKETHSRKMESEYKNYKNYPSNYFEVKILSLDEINKKIKVKAKGRLYSSDTDLNSDFIDLEVELYMSYTEKTYSNSNYILPNDYHVEEYFNAKFNSVLWTARQNKYYYGYTTLTSTDPYRIDIRFDKKSAEGDYYFNSSSTDNYVKFYKFNVETLVFDQYDVEGTLSCSYREYHGGYTYSYIGKLDLKAVNKSNPSDVVTVSDGIFRVEIN